MPKTATEAVELLHKEWLECDEPHWGDKVHWGQADLIAQKIDEAMNDPVLRCCDKAPPGFYCVRAADHVGACSTYPEQTIKAR